MWHDDEIIYIVMGVIIGAIVGYGAYYLVKKDNARYQQLMNQCLSDGRKEYECVGILRGNRSNTIIIPTRSR